MKSAFLATILLAVATSCGSGVSSEATHSVNGWAVVREAMRAGKSVYWQNGHVTVPLTRSERLSASPLSTEFRRNVVQDSAAGYMIQGGVVDRLEVHACAVELWLFLIEPFNPDPNQPAPDTPIELRAFVVAISEHGERSVSREAIMTSRDATSYRGTLQQQSDGNAIARITDGTQVTVSSIDLDLHAACES